MGLIVLGIGADNEMILADINWIVTASSTVYVGTVPVLIDIPFDVWYPDLAFVEAIITSYMKVIVVTHLHGNLCEVDHLLDIGKRHGIPVIEDAVEAISSYWYGYATGSQGISGTFSFHGIRTMITDEDGMFVTNSRVLYSRVTTLNNHGHVPGGR